MEVLPTLPANHFQTCVTSPPYFGLRDYGTGSWSGGHDPTCQHAKNVWEGAKQTQGAQSGHAAKQDKLARQQCSKCGAVRTDRQFGLEPTPEAYIAQLVTVFAEVRRALRNDGTLWLNLGDSYANDSKWGGSSGGKHATALHGQTSIGRTKKLTGAKAKDLLMMPARVALALQADGWWLRSAIVWNKTNPMPESVKTRPTSSYEMVYLLAKSEQYYYNADAIRETSVCDRMRGSALHPDQVSTNGNAGLARRVMFDTRNARNVWTINTQSYKGAHFATMAPELARRCILAGCPEGGHVLDPFGGAGTTGLVAAQSGRQATLIELNKDYAALTRERLGYYMCDSVDSQQMVEPAEQQTTTDTDAEHPVE